MPTASTRIRAYFSILRSPDHSGIRAWSVFAAPFRPCDKSGRLVAVTGLSLDFSKNVPLANGRLWREADVRGAILESAAVGKTIAAKRGSRGALELWPTIEQGTNRLPSTLCPFTIV
jgi:hypothetical protein